MVEVALSPAPGSRAERTRNVILAQAERLFSERGFEATRLEDVATAVGIRRASIVYHFRGKRELYDAVLGEVFRGFRIRLTESLAAPGPLSARIEAAVSTFVRYVGERPSLARLLLREVASAGPGAQGRPLVLDHIAPFVTLVREFIREQAGSEAEVLAPADPAHLASTIAGATIFFVAAMPTLVPESSDPLAAEPLAAHEREMLRITRRWLGIPRRQEAT